MTSAFIFSFILGIFHYWNEKFFFKNEESQSRSVSFVAGVSLAYVFLLFFPELSTYSLGGKYWIYVILLAGFSCLHAIERYFYSHLKGWKRIWREKEIHYLVLFGYYFAIGSFSYFLFLDNFLRGVLFAIPVVFYAAIGPVSFTEIHKHIRGQVIFRVLISIAALCGVLFGPVLSQWYDFYFSLLSFVMGAFLYIVLMDFIPSKDKGRPMFFLLGSVFYTMLIMLMWSI